MLGAEAKAVNVGKNRSMSENRQPTVSGAQTQAEVLKKLLHNVVERHTDPALLVELYYYSTEPELLSMIRSYIAMSPNAKKLLALFLELTQAHPETISAAVHVNGDLTLSSPASVGLSELIARGALASKTVYSVQ